MLIFYIVINVMTFNCGKSIYFLKKVCNRLLTIIELTRKGTVPTPLPSVTATPEHPGFCGNFAKPVALGMVAWDFQSSHFVRVRERDGKAERRGEKRVQEKVEKEVEREVRKRNKREKK